MALMGCWWGGVGWTDSGPGGMLVRVGWDGPTVTLMGCWWGGGGIPL